VEAPPAPIAKKIPRERLEFTRQLWLEGVAEHRLQQRVAEKFNVTLRTARRYLARVRAAFAKHPSAEIEAIRARADAMLLDVYDKAQDHKVIVPKKDGADVVEQPDLRTMATVAWRLAELHGAVAPKRHEHEHSSGGSPLTFYMPRKVSDGEGEGGAG
jgi:hypothetical protein